MPDALDFRDRPFRPNVAQAPRPSVFPTFQPAVKNQGQTNACTGFALSVVVESLLHRAGRERDPSISPYMLYSMARRYDEYPGSVGDNGSSARGALKGWFKHGACALKLFPSLEMPPPQPKGKAGGDWWLDAVRRPLGAYYRIDARNITDMQCALNEVGAIYATVGCHSGWDTGIDQPTLRSRPKSIKGIWMIPRMGGHAAHPGHAIAIVGYDDRGFLVQNSWGREWGSYGYGILGYDDWIDNAIDCWVAQLGVVTADHEALSKAVTLRTHPSGTAQAGDVLLASGTVLRNRELSPFIINMGNDGKLSNSGNFRTTPDDVKAIADIHLPQARKLWKLGEGDPIDVCIYAHGGLVDEDAAAAIAAKWIPMLYDRRIFPIFLMWETGFMETLVDMVEDATKDQSRVAGGMLDGLKSWWNQRLERLLSRPGFQLWGQMKQNAQAISAYDSAGGDDDQTGAMQLYLHFLERVKDLPIRLHFVGHSAGSIVVSWMIDRILTLGARHGAIKGFESVSFMAPAVRVDTFGQCVLPHLSGGKIGRYQQFHLSDQAEQADPTCGPYRRSLLYLVSESFEGGASVPILGMQKFWDALAAVPRATANVSPGPKAQSTTHGGFDDDATTQQSVLDFIRPPA